MTKFTSDTKLMIIEGYNSKITSQKEYAKQLGVTRAQFQYWLKLYELHGEEGLKNTYTNCSVGFKLDVLNYMVQTGASLMDTAALFKLSSYTMVYDWQKKMEVGGVEALEPKQKGRLSMKNKSTNQPKEAPAKGSVEAYEARIRQLEMENEYFKKVECLSSKKITKQDKAQVVYELRHKYPVKALVKLADIPRSTYYDLVKRMKRPDSDSDLKAEIKAIYEEHEGRYGYRRIRDELTIRGQKVNHKKVQRIMKELGLKCLVRMKKYKSYKGTVGKIAPNHLDRQFTADAPNQKWVTDITEFKLFGEKLYLSPVLDLFNGEIITYTIGSRPTYSLVSKMLEKALERLPEEHELLMHSDQGWHYQMKQYCHALQERGIIQSMSRKGNCYDNSVMENFFGIMKSEFLYYKEFESIEHFMQELEKYMKYYNTKRMKAKLKMSPVQYRTHFEQAA
ncbi:IS3 family transposase [Anaerobacillus alkaliphilus]|uniref:IS3 family transposase n=2 Tax=Anaerobacillus alkaliphilus TaxID=1548597 RepID=A0A4Q0VRR6_9BACI|nr:IS3 family transposase [Anaerobacillus alkaliphilus]RXI96623.1 IS3 family transposase [Anaerobacillus alkaliphilus]RXI98434.1 IS3 family transposase [Anaerobacillus alkaliphilus]RXI98617.1 IS3 family transposase [Anaerobacillus alkaliphilus]RXI99942.1 IS3 family transposase [Anaerobacillus alkaliphilus]